MLPLRTATTTAALRRVTHLVVLGGGRSSIGGDRSGDWRDDVGGIEPAAEADLENRRFDAGAAKELERDSGRHFEKRGMRLQHPLGEQLLDHRPHVRDGGDHLVCRDRTPVDHEAFGQVDEVR